MDKLEESDSDSDLEENTPDIYNNIIKIFRQNIQLFDIYNFNYKIKFDYEYYQCDENCFPVCKCSKKSKTLVCLANLRDMQIQFSNNAIYDAKIIQHKCVQTKIKNNKIIINQTKKLIETTNDDYNGLLNKLIESSQLKLEQLKNKFNNLLNFEKLDLDENFIKELLQGEQEYNYEFEFD